MLALFLMAAALVAALSLLCLLVLFALELTFSLTVSRLSRIRLKFTLSAQLMLFQYYFYKTNFKRVQNELHKGDLLIVKQTY